MPVKEVAEGVEKLEILDKDGNVDEELEPDIPEDKLLDMYRDFVFARKFDQKAFKLQRRGDSGTYAPFKGEEACQIGPAYALDEDDWFVPSFREGAFALSRGYSPSKLMRYFMGDEYGNRVGGTHSLPVSIPVGSHMIHAAGIGMAKNIREEKGTVITYFGDGSTSQGDFHSAMNFAGVYNSPVIFFNQNNRYAISTPREKQTASETIAQKAKAYGIKGMQVDGNDILACYKAAKDAKERAENGEGPTLIEGLTYRLGVHTTSDDPSRYRSEDEEKKWEEKEPLIRFEKYLMDRGILTEEKKQEIEKETQERLDKETEKAMEMEDPEIDNMFRYNFENVPDRQKRQLERIKEREGGDR